SQDAVPMHSRTRILLPVKSAPLLSTLQVLPEDTECSDDQTSDTGLELRNKENFEDDNEIVILPKQDHTSIQKTKQTKIDKAKFCTKMTILLACWIFFTSVFLLYNETDQIIKNSVISFGEDKRYAVPHTNPDSSIKITLFGPFISPQRKMELNKTELDKISRMTVWVEPLEGNESQVLGKMESTPWILYLQDKVDFNDGDPYSHTFKLQSTAVSSIRMNTTSTQTVPFAMSMFFDPLDAKTSVVYALVLLTGLYVLIMFEIINRTMAAILIATLSLAALSLAGERPSLPEVISWLDGETLLLLFGMMLLVAIMAETGIFDFLAVFTFEVTKGRLWPLILLLGGITAFLSTFLDNVTTVLLLSPVTI
ncbi:uncharacterized protein LOC113236205, partial [Hyposmocoma kahamanoa]|uniref:uncharacterized protein LOC113236205 n=1 Tax=Hyposmocoma kahamanoa TaxID=1477025 RepID=UPI000E6D8351